MSQYPNIKEIRTQALVANNSAFNVHDNLKHLSVPELQEVSRKDRLPWHTMTINLTGDLNVGTIIRTSHLLGAASVIVVGRTKIDRRSMVGAENYIDVKRYNTMEDVLTINTQKVYDILKENNLTPIFVENNGRDLTKIDWRFRCKEMNRTGTTPCLVMGNETGGIPDSILALENEFPLSFKLSVPQLGVIRSFNVAVAHAIVAYSLSDSFK